MTGKTFGELTVLNYEKDDKQGCARWLCNCSCGKKKVVRGSHLRAGKIVSCGHVAREASIRNGKARKTHGRSKTPEYHRERWLLRKYAMTVEDYNELLIEQDYACAICKKHVSEFERPLFVDHDHATGVIRGLLCNACNNILGQAYDNIEILKESINYLMEKSE